MAAVSGQSAEGEWITFPGGELEGKRPKALCAACRERLKRAASGPANSSGGETLPGSGRTLCFQCYRSELARERGLVAAGQLDTASTERFQSALPFEAVNVPRLEMLRLERVAARTAGAVGVGVFVD